MALAAHQPPRPRNSTQQQVRVNRTSSRHSGGDDPTEPQDVLLGSVAAQRISAEAASVLASIDAVLAAA